MAPDARSFLLTSGSASARVTAALSFTIIGRGVRAGASSPYQLSDWVSG